VYRVLEAFSLNATLIFTLIITIIIIIIIIGLQSITVNRLKEIQEIYRQTDRQNK